MTPEQAMHRIQKILSHAWMIRNFLKHAEEIQDDVAMMEVHREIFDAIRALESCFLANEATRYVTRARAKHAKLKKASDFFRGEYKRISDHTNFEMASQSLAFAVEQIDETLRQVAKFPEPEGEA